jgi:hypothetical protein
VVLRHDPESPSSDPGGIGTPRAQAAPRGALMTVWVYMDTSKEVGDADHLKVFANEDVADAWFRDNDPEGVAFEYRIIRSVPPPAASLRRRGHAP